MVQGWVWTASNRTLAQSARQQEVGQRTGRHAGIREDGVSERRPLVTRSPGGQVTMRSSFLTFNHCDPGGGCMSSFNWSRFVRRR